MKNTGFLKGKTVFITGASRGIGLAIAKKCAADGANIVIAARTAKAKNEGDKTIFTAAAEIESLGAKCLPYQVDVKNEEQVRSAINKAVETFGGIDIVVNNCSYLNLTNMENTDSQKYDDMFHIISRGAYLVSKLSIPYLKKSKHAHILNLSPPINLDPIWLKLHMAYTSFKYNISLYTIGMSEEFKEYNIAVNSLWPEKVIYSTGMEEMAGEKAKNFCRSMDIMADAAYAILIKDPKTYTGNLKLDEEILAEEGIFDLEQYREVKGSKEELLPDLFVNEAPDFTVINK